MGLLGPGISEGDRDYPAERGSGRYTPARGRALGDPDRGTHTAPTRRARGGSSRTLSTTSAPSARTAFEDLPASAFVSIPGLGWDRLAGAEGYAACRVEVERETPEALRIGLVVVGEEVLDPRCVPVNRGRCAVIEATVHATRYGRTRDPRLGRLIEHHAAVVRRCGGPAEVEALELLMGYIDSAPI